MRIQLLKIYLIAVSYSYTVSFKTKLFTDKLTENEGILYLDYKDGMAYNDNVNHRSAQMNFYCDPDEKSAKINKVVELDHVYYFNWLDFVYILVFLNLILRFYVLVCIHNF